MIKVETVAFHQATSEIKEAIKNLLQVIWPTIDNGQEVHRKDLKIQSFYIMNNKQIVSYAAVIQLEVTVGNELFQIGGLSCVATLPFYARQGLGSKVVATASQWISEKLDFGVFTCAIELVSFYRRAGNWKLAPNVLLIANNDKDALSSDNLDVVVLMNIFSKRALFFQKEILSSKIYLGLAKGQFI